jgi:hypothetical protein
MPSDGSPRQPLLRDRSAGQRVTNIELFFDLVYVFAVTQLSHHLLGDPTVRGALQTALLLAMVWLVWAYTTWVTNWMNPERLELRGLLVALMLVSLAMSAALPRAFAGSGLLNGPGLARGDRPRPPGDRPGRLRRRRGRRRRCLRPGAAGGPFGGKCGQRPLPPVKVSVTKTRLRGRPGRDNDGAGSPARAAQRGAVHFR